MFSSTRARVALGLVLLAVALVMQGVAPHVSEPYAHHLNVCGGALVVALVLLVFFWGADRMEAAAVAQFERVCTAKVPALIQTGLKLENATLRFKETDWQPIVYRNAAGSIVQVLQDYSAEWQHTLGTGFIVGKGLVVTLSDFLVPGQVYIVRKGDKNYTARIAAVDERSGLAVLRIARKDWADETWPALELQRETFARKVMAVGVDHDGSPVACLGKYTASVGPNPPFFQWYGALPRCNQFEFSLTLGEDQLGCPILTQEGKVLAVANKATRGLSIGTSQGTPCHELANLLNRVKNDEI